MIIVVSYHDDPHAVLVEKAIRESGFSDTVWLDLERVLDELRLVVAPATWTLTDRKSGKLVSAHDARTIWWRRTGKLPTPNSHADLSQADFVEAYWATRWLMESLPDRCFPFGHPRHLRVAENKLLQLQVAQKVGFKCPDYYIGNDRAQIMEFCRSQERCVVKPLYLSAVREGTKDAFTFYTTAIESSTLLESLAQQEKTAMLFVETCIQKSRDVRAIVFPDGTYFACEIDSSTLPSGEVDWRPTTMTHPHVECQLPADVLSKGMDYLRTMRLSSGSFDFGITSDGHWVFFECNPNGQWLWMELKTGVPLARRFASILTDHHQGSLGGSWPTD
ncbi:MAG TPA: hypothetical protein VJZ71_05880 [Phycisphaerae bacterium]|nr:hypothetical protein [Phycisphaerae bacterium]